MWKNRTQLGTLNDQIKNTEMELIRHPDLKTESDSMAGDLTLETELKGIGLEGAIVATTGVEVVLEAEDVLIETSFQSVLTRITHR
jgi:hypothetical protein